MLKMANLKETQKPLAAAGTNSMNHFDHLCSAMQVCPEGGIEEKGKASQGGTPSEVAASKKAEKPSAPTKKPTASAPLKSPGARAKPAGQKGIMSFFGKR